MKKTFQLAGLAVVAFVLGLTGTYYVLPTIFPERISGLTDDSTSQAVVDSMVRARMDQARSDSIAAVEAAALELVGLTPDSLDTLRLLAGQTQTLRDSLARLTDSLDEEASRARNLSREVTALEEKLAQAGNYDQKAEEISAAFTDMEDDEMEEILAHTKPRVLQAIYAKASTRDRPRILRALPPEFAARFMEVVSDPTIPIDSLNAGTALANDSTGRAPNAGQANQPNRR